jgi:hypothetical protein
MGIVRFFTNRWCLVFLVLLISMFLTKLGKFETVDNDCYTDIYHNILGERHIAYHHHMLIGMNVA